MLLGDRGVPAGTAEASQDVTRLDPGGGVVGRFGQRCDLARDEVADAVGDVHVVRLEKRADGAEVGHQVNRGSRLALNAS